MTDIHNLAGDFYMMINLQLAKNMHSSLLNFEHMSLHYLEYWRGNWSVSDVTDHAGVTYSTSNHNFIQYILT